MSKITIEPTTLLVPLPSVMVTCQRLPERPNIITIAWTGIVCSEPPMLSISIRHNRHSYQIIKSSGEFVVNITTRKLVTATDICGTYSGRDYDKFQLAGLTPASSVKVMVPIIAESPINLECQTRKVLELGTHDMFIAEIVAVQIDNRIQEGNGKINIEKLDPLVYCTNAREYWVGLTSMVGKYGAIARESVKK